MNDYFSNVKQGLGDAVERRAHLRWYSRLLRAPYGRPLAVVFAALVVATPALGAVTNWFSFGKPNSLGPLSPAFLFGVVKPGHSRMLPILVPDPKGGPAWGLRLVRTTRGDTCVEIGRVERGQLGSLGIDDAWGNDHRFHVIPANSRGAMQCGATDAVGHGYLNGAVYSESASVNIVGDWPSAIKTGGCQPSGPGAAPGVPFCPPGAERMIFYGLLGRDARSITYREPGGSFATKQLLRGVGAYLLVFTRDAKTCDEYAKSFRSSVDCSGETEGGSSTPSVPGAVTKVTYVDGRTCNLGPPPARLLSAYRAFVKRAARELLGLDFRKRARHGVSVKVRREFERMLAGFAGREHLSLEHLRRELNSFVQCPAVGWVSPKGPKVTAADVATPIHVRLFAVGVFDCSKRLKLKLPDGCNGGSDVPSREVPVEWSFKARRAVTNSRSWYSWSITDPGARDCDEQGAGSSFSTFRNIRAGQTLRFSELYAAQCRGRYAMTVTYTHDAPPGEPDNGQGGGLLVGRTTFTIR